MHQVFNSSSEGPMQLLTDSLSEHDGPPSGGPRASRLLACRLAAPTPHVGKAHAALTVPLPPRVGAVPSTTIAACTDIAGSLPHGSRRTNSRRGIAPFAFRNRESSCSDGAAIRQATGDRTNRTLCLCASVCRTHVKSLRVARPDPSLVRAIRMRPPKMSAY